MAELNIVTGKIEIDASALAKVINGLKQTKEGAEGVESVFQELGTTSDAFLKELDKGLKSSGAGFKSLSAQIKDAKNEAQALADKFGASSSQAVNAQKRVAELSDELSNFNKRVKALDPGAKFNAVSNALQGTLGALQGVTGALQLFGAESEDVTKIAQKLQGALNLAQGLNSVTGLKDAFKDLGIVLGITSTAQKALAVATVETEVAMEGAKVATLGFGQALKATGIGLAVAAIGTMLAGIAVMEDDLDMAAEADKERARQRQADADELNDIYQKQIGSIEQQIKLLQVQGGEEVKIAKLEKDVADKRVQGVEAFIDKFGKTKELADKLLQVTREQELAEAKLTKARYDAYINLLKQEQAQRDREQAATEALRAQFDSELQAQLSVIDQQTAIQKNFNRVMFNDANDRRAADLASEISNLEEKKKKMQEFGKDTQLIESEIAAKKKELGDLELAEFEAREQRKREIIRGSLDIVTGLFTDLLAQQVNTYDQDVAALEKQNEKKLITEEQYQAGLRKIKRRQAEEQKKLAIFQATLDFSNALVNALTFKPATGVPAALILATAVAGANLARAIATPIPKFRKGQMPSLTQPFSTEDNTFAMVGKSEAIIPAEQTKAFYPTLDAIYRGHISPAKLNDYVRGSKKQGPGISIDTGGVIRAIKKNKGVQIENAHTIAKLIAKEISAGYDPRKRI